jgi:hypothetical protein
MGLLDCRANGRWQQDPRYRDTSQKLVETHLGISSALRSPKSFIHRELTPAFGPCDPEALRSIRRISRETSG